MIRSQIKIAVYIVFALLTTCSGAHSGQFYLLPGTGQDGPAVLIPVFPGGLGGLVAMESDPAQEEPPPTPEQEDDTVETPAAAEQPLRPFQPSEKIKADQAVDFPYDI